MSFIKDNEGLFAVKVGLDQIATSKNPVNFISDSDVNKLMQADKDIQSWLRGDAPWYGLTPVASDPAPAGLTNYVWLKNDATLWQTVSGVATQIGGGGGGSATSISVKDSPYAAHGDGTTDDTAAIQAAHNAAAMAGRPLYFPPGTYKVTDQGTSFGIPNHCLLIAANSANVRWTGDGTATLVWDSRVPNCVHVDTGTTKFSAEGIAFEGYTVAPAANEFVTNAGVAFYIAKAVLDVDIQNCFFEHATPTFVVSDDVGARFTFHNNRVINSPNAINAATYSTITDNWFFNDFTVATRSHGVYLFGHFEKCIITGNHFKNITAADIQIRATDARHLQKRTFLISNNIFELSRQYAIWIAGASRVNLGSGLITGNLFKNCGATVFLYGARDVLIGSNHMEWDYEFVANNGFGINVSASTSDSVPSGCVVSDNILINRHPFFAALVIVSEPADGDTVVIGTVTYTWRTTPAAAGDVQRSSNVDTCAGNLSETIAGHASGAGAVPMNLVLRDQSDAFHSANSTEGLVVIASEKTFTVSVTGTAATFKTTRAFLEPASIPADDPVFDTVIQAKSAYDGLAGNTITVTLTGDSGSKAGSISDSTIDVVLHYKPGASQVSDMETLIATSTHIEVKSAGVASNVLDVNAAFASSPLFLGRDAVVDGTGFANPPIQIGVSRETTVARNKITGCSGGAGIVVNSAYRPYVADNEIHNSTLGIQSDHNIFPVYERNRVTITNDRPGRPNNIDALSLLVSYDAFPVIHDMDLTGRVGQVAQNKLIPHLQGTSGIVSVGDGKHHGFVWYGSEQYTSDDDASAQFFRWKDGDVFAVLDDNVSFSFTFSRTITSATTQFNSYTTLVALINTQTSGLWVASNPETTYFGSDSFGDGYIEVKAASTGVGANGYMAVGVASGKRMSLMNGVLLVRWTEGDTFSYMAGGAATRIKTVVFTPLASKAAPLFVQGIDATSQALNPIAYQADTIPGICYVITHSAAAGTEKFFWRVG
jgi:hypothetical protein